MTTSLPDPSEGLRTGSPITYPAEAYQALLAENKRLRARELELMKEIKRLQAQLEREW